MELLVAAFVIVPALAVYFAPSIIARIRQNRKFPAILAVNLLLGWTLIGWIGALIWSFRDEPPSSDNC
jgi:hypothetical protein